LSVSDTARAKGRRVGLYPGTFDPVTLGHLDVIQRARKLVDHLIIGVAKNDGKGPLFSTKERMALVQAEVDAMPDGEGLGSIQIEVFDRLLMSYASDLGAEVIFRGLRAVSDFEYEFQMACMNRSLNDRIETVFLMAEPEHQAIASRLVKEIARLGGDVSSFVTPSVHDALKARYSRPD
jgi:pantetheine-phosphate adenylyltransferase